MALGMSIGLTQGTQSFDWYRAAAGFAVALLPSLLSLKSNIEPRSFDGGSPFAEPWVLCDRIEYGWPLRVVRFTANASEGCVGLPDVDWLAMAFDLSLVCGLALLVG